MLFLVPTRNYPGNTQVALNFVADTNGTSRDSEFLVLNIYCTHSKNLCSIRAYFKAMVNKMW
jgi:hypothetical protein